MNMLLKLLGFSCVSRIEKHESRSVGGMGDGSFPERGRAPEPEEATISPSHFENHHWNRSSKAH